MEEGPPPAGYRESRDDERGVPRQCPRSDMGCGGRSGRSAGLTPSALLSFPAFGVMCWRKVMRRRENKYRRRWYAWPTWEAIESIPTFACLGIVRRGIVFSKRSRGRSASSARLEDLADPSVVRTSQRAKSLKSRSRAGFTAETQKNATHDVPNRTRTRFRHAASRSMMMMMVQLSFARCARLALVPPEILRTWSKSHVAPIRLPPFLRIFPTMLRPQLTRFWLAHQITPQRRTRRRVQALSQHLTVAEPAPCHRRIFALVRDFDAVRKEVTRASREVEFFPKEDSPYADQGRSRHKVHRPVRKIIVPGQCEAWVACPVTMVTMLSLVTCVLAVKHRSASRLSLSKPLSLDLVVLHNDENW